MRKSSSILSGSAQLASDTGDEGLKADGVN